MKKFVSFFLSVVTVLCMAGCRNYTSSAPENGTFPSPENGTPSAVASSPGVTVLTPSDLPDIAPVMPKYVFLFIGDGMSYPQIQVTADILGAREDPDDPDAILNTADNNGAKLDGPSALGFMNFPSVGSAVTYDLNSFVPDSASAATAIATGNKTCSGAINVNTATGQTYETIAEKVHAQCGMKVGIISSVNINHATPAAFYAHQPSRNNFYEIGLELMDSGFEFFAGGEFLSPTGNDKDREDLYALAEKAGYKVTRTADAADAVALGDAKVLMTVPNPADSGALPYEIDRADEMWSLADYVGKGIEVLANDNGFFMMVEGGKIDWAGHANDAATVIRETTAFADAVDVAVHFSADHPGETLILVTGDHETGGLGIGYAGTGYNTYLTLLDRQTISFSKFNSDYVALYKKNQTDFATILTDISSLFGLKKEGDATDRSVLTAYEMSLLQTAYNKSVLGLPTGLSAQEESELYGSAEPLTVTVTHILDHKAGLDFTTYAHTGLPVPVFATGVGADKFEGYYDNTAIFARLADLLCVS